MYWTAVTHFPQHTWASCDRMIATAAWSNSLFTTVCHCFPTYRRAAPTGGKDSSGHPMAITGPALRNTDATVSSKLLVRSKYENLSSLKDQHWRSRLSSHHRPGLLGPQLPASGGDSTAGLINQCRNTAADESSQTSPQDALVHRQEEFIEQEEQRAKPTSTVSHLATRQTVLITGRRLGPKGLLELAAGTPPDFMTRYSLTLIDESRCHHGCRRKIEDVLKCQLKMSY